MRAYATSDTLTVDLADESDADRLGRAIAAVAGPGTVIGLVGPLGAGKTRLTRSIAEALGVDPGAVSSPTYVLIHEYEGRLPVYHFDAYRLGGPGPFESLGAADYWDAGGVCLVEWADLVEEVLPESTWWVAIEPTGPTTRRVLLRVTIPPGVVDAVKHGLDGL
jgi:tRNA threonylcarbamoyladenosine biosynthesis protein TsaE